MWRPWAWFYDEDRETEDDLWDGTAWKQWKETQDDVHED